MITTPVVIDTSVLVALVDANDKWHSVAVALRDSLLTVNVPLVYYDCVISEAVGVIARRSEEQKRPAEFRGLLTGLIALVPEPTITWLAASMRSLYSEILNLCRDHDGKLNFNDVLIALGCRRLGISLIASFDSDFDTLSWLTRIGDPVTAPELIYQVASRKGAD